MILTGETHQPPLGFDERLIGVIYLAQDLQTTTTIIVVIVGGKTHQAPLRLDERPIGAIHLVVEATGVAEVVPVPISTPQRGRSRSAVDALPTLCIKRVSLLVNLSSPQAEA